MPIRAWLINWVSNLNRDHQIGGIHQAILDDGVISGLEVTTWQVSTGTAIVRCVRTSTTPNETVFVSVDITTAEVIDTTGTKKVWLKVLDANVNDPSLNINANGTGIAVIQTGVSYPAGNYVPLAGIVSGVITDERIYSRLNQNGLSLRSLKTVRATSTTPLTLSSLNNGATLDSITLATGDNILLTAQSDQKENGIWRVRASGGPVRANGWQRGDELWRSAVLANEGGTNARKLFVNTNTSAITIGVTNITFLELSVSAPNSISSTYTAWETISAWQVLAIDEFFEDSQVQPTTEQVDWWSVTAKTRYAQEIVIGSTILTDKISLRQRRVNTATATLITIRIETNSGGLPTGTLVDANATVSFDPATLTTSLANYTYTFPGSFTLVNGTTYHVVFSHNGTVASANDFRISWQWAPSATTTHRNSNFWAQWDGATWTNTDNNAWIRFLSTSNGRVVSARADNPQRFAPIGIASGASTSGNPVTVSITGADTNQSGLVANSGYFVSNTPWTVWNSPGTNVAFVGTAINATTLKFEPQDGLAKAIWTSWFLSLSNTTAIGNCIPTWLSWRNKSLKWFSLPANYFYAWKRIRFVVLWTLSLVTPNVFSIDTPGIWVIWTLSFNDASVSWVWRVFRMEVECVCRTAWVSGSLFQTRNVTISWSSSPPAIITNSQNSNTFDTTIPRNIGINAYFATANASNTFTISDFYFEELS